MLLYLIHYRKPKNKVTPAVTEKIIFVIVKNLGNYHLILLYPLKILLPIYVFPYINIYIYIYMLWSDSIHLTDTKYFIHDPFNYDTHDDIIKPNPHVVLTHWEFFLYFCTRVSIVPPTLSISIVRKLS